jgi:hemerythrin-like domain-containing protein
MKTATKNLEDDHVHIILLIEVMEKLTRSGKPDIGHLEIIVDIIRNFADGLHHAKEENLFFPFLGTRGFSATQGPVAVMLHEHALGRDYVKSMTESIASYKSGNEAALTGIFSNMTGYAELLRAHISKENNILFRMADNVLTETDQISLLESFAEAERKHLLAGSVKDYPSQINDLAIYYKITNN